MTTFYYPYRMTLTDPVIITELAGDPNSASTRDFIPGSAVRGVVARDLAGSDKFDEYILSGRVRYLNAYPEVSESRSIPTPLCWVKTKYSAPAGEADHIDLSADGEWPGEQLEAAGFRYSGLSSVAARLGRNTDVEVAMHHVRDRKAGGPGTGEVGTLFQYEAIREDQVFRGAIAVDADTAQEADAEFENIKDCLSLCSLGRSAETEYGGHPVVELQPREEREPGSGLGLPEGVAAGKKLLCLLTSAYAGANPHTGQSDPSAIATELESKLGVKVTSRFWAFCLEGGFNARWGLPLPQERCLKAGSVLVLTAERQLSAADLAQIEASGLGGRRAEGFGRVAFVDAASLSRDFTIEPDGNNPADEETCVCVSEDAVLAGLQRRLLRSALEEQLRFRAATHARAASGLPSPSLISGFRQALRDASLQQFSDRVSHFEKKVRDWKVDGKPLQQWAVVAPDKLREWLNGLQLGGVIQSHSLDGTTDLSRLTAEDMEDLRRVYLEEALALMARKARGNRE